MKEESVWNCNNSTLFLSLSELRKPALSFMKELSSGAKRVNPLEVDDDDDVMSCELSWLINCVVLRRRMRMENFLAFVRI